MTGIDYFAWLVFIVIIVSVVYVFVVLAQLHGQVARKRGHPQADAINVAGWLGIQLSPTVLSAVNMIMRIAQSTP